MKDTKQLEADLKRAREQAKNLEEALAEARAEEILERQKPLRELAHRAHNLLCAYNHTDGCGYGYEGDDWTGHAHKRWLDKVEQCVAGGDKFQRSTVEEFTAFLDGVAAIRQVCPKWRYIMQELNRL